MKTSNFEWPETEGSLQDVLQMFEMYLRNQRKNKVQTIKEIILENLVC